MVGNVNLLKYVGIVGIYKETSKISILFRSLYV